jgi:hypothetical protein
MDIFIFILCNELDIFKKNDLYYVLDTDKNKIYEINKLINTVNKNMIKDIICTDENEIKLEAENWFESERRKLEIGKIFHIQSIINVDNANIIQPQNIEYDIVSNNLLIKKDIILNYLFYEKKLYFLNNYHTKGSYLYSNYLPIIYVPFKKIIQSKFERVQISSDKIYYFDILNIDYEENVLDYNFIVENISLFFNKFFNTNKYTLQNISIQTNDKLNCEGSNNSTDIILYNGQSQKRKLLYYQPKIQNKQNMLLDTDKLNSNNKKINTDNHSEIFSDYKNNMDNYKDKIKNLSIEMDNKYKIKRFAGKLISNYNLNIPWSAQKKNLLDENTDNLLSNKAKCISMNKNVIVNKDDQSPIQQNHFSKTINSNKDKIYEILKKNNISNNLLQCNDDVDTNIIDTKVSHEINNKECSVSITDKDIKIVLITVGWNESKILPMFLNYYSPQVDKIIYYDNQSTDDSINIINHYTNKEGMCEIEIINFDTDNEIKDDLLLDLKNSEWKKYKNKYDWVIIVDVDEFIVPFHNVPLREFLATQNNYGAIQSIGYQMFGSEYNFKEIKRGAKHEQYDKVCCWNLGLLLEINYCHGSHRCNPEFINHKVQIHYKGCQLRHMKYVGDLGELCNRVVEYKKRLSTKNKKNHWGDQYNISFFKKSYLYFSRKLTDVY